MGTKRTDGVDQWEMDVTSMFSVVVVLMRMTEVS